MAKAGLAGSDTATLGERPSQGWASSQENSCEPQLVLSRHIKFVEHPHVVSFGIFATACWFSMHSSARGRL